MLPFKRTDQPWVNLDEIFLANAKREKVSQHCNASYIFNFSIHFVNAFNKTHREWRKKRSEKQRVVVPEVNKKKYNCLYKKKLYSKYRLYGMMYVMQINFPFQRW